MTHARSLIAFNTATESENRIHDDTVASRFGFSGGLVPGVDVFGYLAHMPVALWGQDWLASGALEARFFKPVYDGDEVLTSASDRPDGGLDLDISARGVSCAKGSASRLRPPAPGARLPRSARIAADQRPPASPSALPIGRVLGTLEETYTREDGLQHLHDIRDDASLFDDGRIANPAWLLRRCNHVLMETVNLGPWIHVESRILLHSLARDGDAIETRAVVVDNRETKGHLLVELDVQILSGDRFILSGRHIAIYEPRQVREGAR
jgi:hypothetical protein